MRPETLCIHAGYEPENGGARALPIYQSTTFKFDSTEHVGALFDLTAGDAFYTRLGNPTTDAVEKKIAALEGGVGALCTSSGQAATLLATLNIAQAGDHIVCASAVYGGTFNLLGVTLKKMGVDVTFVDGDAPLEELQKAIEAKIREKEDNLVGNMASQGTTPRRLTDLIGSLCDLTSGSGDKGTPIVLVQGYFDNFTN